MNWGANPSSPRLPPSPKGFVATDRRDLAEIGFALGLLWVWIGFGLALLFCGHFAVNCCKFLLFHELRSVLGL